MDLQALGALPEAMDNDPGRFDVSTAEVARVVEVSLSDVSFLDIGSETPPMNRIIGLSDPSRLIRQAVCFDDGVTCSRPLIQSPCRSNGDSRHEAVTRSVESLSGYCGSSTEVCLRRRFERSPARLVV